MGFWCCVVVPKTALLFIPLLIYIWNRFLQPIWSNFWNGEEKIEMDKKALKKPPGPQGGQGMTPNFCHH